MNKKRYEDVSAKILELVGGKENVSQFTHCMTRLRFIIKDKSIVKVSELEQLPGVLGTRWFGEQLQVIIGAEVENIYKLICKQSGMQAEVAIHENLDTRLAKGAKRNVLTKIINALSRSVLPIIDVIIPAAFFMLIVNILGPSQLGILSAESDLYRLLSLVADAGFYFLPVYMGVSAAKTFGATPLLGAFMGAVLVHPSLIEIVNAGDPFTVYGIPMTLVSYTSTTIPVFLSVWLMSYVERFFRKYLPKALIAIFAPLLTVAVMLPVELCVVGPVGSWMGTGFISVVTWLAAKGSVASFIVTTVIGGVWILTVLFGFNMPLYMLALEIFNAGGMDKVIFPGVICSFFALIGIALGAFLKFMKMKRNDESGRCLTYLITLAIGGISEPCIYGIGVRFKKPFIFMCIGGAVGAALTSILRVYVYSAVAHSGLFAALGFLGGSSVNAVLGIICAMVSLAVSAVLTYLFGIDEKRLENENN